MGSTNIADICISGAGMVGLSLANQIGECFPILSIAIIDKEESIGKHTSSFALADHIIETSTYFKKGITDGC